MTLDDIPMPTRLKRMIRSCRRTDLPLSVRIRNVIAGTILSAVGSLIVATAVIGLFALVFYRGVPVEVLFAALGLLALGFVFLTVAWALMRFDIW